MRGGLMCGGGSLSRGGWGGMGYDERTEVVSLGFEGGHVPGEEGRLGY